MKKKVKEIVQKERNNQELGARRSLLEEIFYDFNRSKTQIYKINFIRGIFFGFGSALGGTVLIALLIWLLTLFIDVVPGLNGFIEASSNFVENANEQ